MSLTVKDLKTLLAEPNIEDHYIVVLAKDAEGNSFSQVPAIDGMAVGVYIPDTSCSGDFVAEEDDAEFSPNSIAFYPTN